MNNVLKYFSLAFQVAQTIAAAEAQLEAGQPVNAPGIRTYIGKQHVEVDIAVKKIP